MKFLVVGASGFVGGAILAHARALGFEAVGTQAGARDPGLITFDLARDRIGDCVAPAFFASGDPVAVVVAAAITDMDRCHAQPEATRLVNVDGTIRLIEDARARNARCVFLSSCFVFDGEQGYYSDDHPHSPVNEYGRHKAEVERFLRANLPDAFIARLSTNVGDTLHQRHLFSQWYDLIARGEPIACIEGLLISPTYVEDVARGVVMACRRGLAGAFNLAGSEFFTRDELARQFCYALGKTPNVICKPLAAFGFRDARALRSYLDSSKFVTSTGMRFTSMREVMKKVVGRLAAG